MEKLALGSDSIDLKRKVDNLRKQCNEYESLLKHFSLMHNDLPPNIQKCLDERSQIQRKLGLETMNSPILLELHCTNTEQNIDKKIAIMKAIECNEKIEKQLVKTNEDLTEAKSFGITIRNNLKQCQQIGQSLRDANLQIDTYIEKKKKLEENINIDLERILMKLEQLSEL